MAPINPVEILDAFSPMLTSSGGIKQVDVSQFKELFRIMKNYSNKLISRCIYCNILKSTSVEVLEDFLKIGGWELIYFWVKSSKDVGNVSFLIDLLKLLYILPMNIDRLRENECPKIVKKLCKHENEEIALKSNQIIKKWTRIIHAFSEKSSGQNGGASSVSTSNNSGNTKEKKRKSSESEPNTTVKKSKVSKVESSINVSASNNANSASDNNTDNNSDSSANVSNTGNGNMLNDSDPYETFSRDEMSKFMVKDTKDNKPRPLTAKVKQGKFRLDLSSSTIKPSNKVKKKTELKDSKVEEAKKVLKSSSSAAAAATGGVDNLKNSKSLISSTHVLKDSVSFMDALSVMPVVNKKRRKINKEMESVTLPTVPNKLESKSNFADTANTSTSTTLSNISNSIVNVSTTTTTTTPTSLTNHNIFNDNSNMSLKLLKSESEDSNEKSSVESQKSPPRFSFYKDILEEKTSENEGDNSASEKAVDNDSTMDVELKTESDIQSMDVSSAAGESALDVVAARDDQLELNNSSTVARNTQKLKPILNYIKKGTKKNVRWPEDSKLEQVKFFELDETERINVNRLSADMKRFDMKHEAQFMLEAKKCSDKSITYAPWKFIPIVLDSQNVPVERGCNSRERQIQADRMKTTLECFYIKDQIPDTPHEPDREFFADSNEQTLIIPLEDENMVDKMHDYSSIQSPNIGDNVAVNQHDYPTIPNNIPISNDIRYNSIGDGSNYAPYAANNNVNSNSGPIYQPLNGSQNSNYGPPVSSNMTTNSNYSYNVPQTNQQQPPPAPSQMFNPVTNNANHNQTYCDYGNTPNYQQPPMISNQNSPPNMPYNSGNSNQAPPPPSNYYNQNGPQQTPPATNTDNGMYNSYWPENNNAPPPNYNPNGPVYSMPQQAPGGGPRFRPRGPCGQRPRGFYSRNSLEICRFFSKFGKCKFENRCNFSHNIDNQKPIRF